MSNVYIRTDSRGRVIACDGGYTVANCGDLTGWTLIDSGEGDRYNLCQSHYFAGGLYTEDGIPRYAYDGRACTLRSEADIEADRAGQAAPEPTELDDLSALLVDHELRLTLLELEV